jgi:hypothetical protein
MTALRCLQVKGGHSPGASPHATAPRPTRHGPGPWPCPRVTPPAQPHPRGRGSPCQGASRRGPAPWLAGGPHPVAPAPRASRGPPTLGRPPTGSGHTPGWRRGPGVLQRHHQRGHGRACHGAVPRPRPDTPSAQVAGVWCAAARATPSGCQSASAEGRYTPHRDGQGARPLAHMDSRTGAGHAHRPLGLSPRLAAGLAGRRGRRGSGVAGRQREASA